MRHPVPPGSVPSARCRSNVGTGITGPQPTAGETSERHKGVRAVEDGVVEMRAN